MLKIRRNTLHLVRVTTVLGTNTSRSVVIVTFHHQDEVDRMDGGGGGAWEGGERVSSLSRLA